MGGRRWVLLRLDAAAAGWLNRVCRGSRIGAWLTGRAAGGLAAVEVLLMLALGLLGRRGSALRMLLAVGVVYLASEGLGRLWPRRRPFAEGSGIVPLVGHAAGRSFPSRHVASALAMALIGGRAHPRLGGAMALLGGGLGLSRIGAGIHYPSDVLAGATLGLVVGRLLREPAKRRSAIDPHPPPPAP